MKFIETKTSRIAAAPAKLNLFFEVYGKRNDGFHEVVSLAVPVTLFDTVCFFPRRDPSFILSVEGGTPDVPHDGENIVVRSLCRLRGETGIPWGGRVHLRKRIPSRAGLGGGSSDAAAALLLADRAWNLNLDRRELMRIGSMIGSDVPLFMLDGGSLGTGRGEQVQACPGTAGLHFVLVKPPEGLSTAAVYRDCMEVHDGRYRRVDGLLAALKNRNVAALKHTLFNRLETPASLIWPRLHDIRNRLLRLGCVASQMSGSGTTVFGLCHSARHARQVAARLKNERIGDVFAVAGR